MAGKTDILLREGDRNVFIAERKFWKGPKAFAEAIDHLLSYATWRDSKAVILVFNLGNNIEEGELIARAIDCAMAAGEVTTDVDPSVGAELRAAAWQAQQADALVAVIRSYLDGGHSGEGGSTAEILCFTTPWQACSAPRPL
jgi:hypothetical protein